jgi:hypothetical protein
MPAPFTSSQFPVRSERELHPLYRAYQQIYQTAMAFYRANVRTKDASFLDPSTFFKYRSRHRNSRSFGRRARTVAATP